MDALDLFNKKNKPLTIGGVPFVKIISIRGGNHAEDNETKRVSDNIKISAKLYDESQRADYTDTEPEETKNEKFKKWVALCEAKDANGTLTVHDFIHPALNAVGVRFVQIVREDYDILEDQIIINMDLKPYNTKEEKDLKRDPPTLKTGSTDEETPDATELAASQGEEEKGMIYNLLKKFDTSIGKLSEDLT